MIGIEKRDAMPVEPVQEMPEKSEAIDDGHLGTDFVELSLCVFFDLRIDDIRGHEQVVVDPLEHVPNSLSQWRTTLRINLCIGIGMIR